MTKNKFIRISPFLLLLLAASCTLPRFQGREENKNIPNKFAIQGDTTNSASGSWKVFYSDPNLRSIIDTALNNNQELNILLQEIQIAKNEVRARKGAYLPFVDGGADGGIERTPRYIRNGAVDEQINIENGKKTPNPLGDVFVGARFSWEVDIWRKLRNSRDAAIKRYLATAEGKNFMVTNLVSEIASLYYELLSFDNQLSILRRNIKIQQDALEVVRMEKASAKVTELAVKKFEAEVLKNQSRIFDIVQRITETENRINFLAGRFPQPIARDTTAFINLKPDTVKFGSPSQLLSNRPDIRAAEHLLSASRLDIKVAKAAFYPSLILNGGAGYQALNPALLLKTPESLALMIAGSLAGPLINRNAIKADYLSANSRKMQAVYAYERSVLNGYVEVANEISNITNLSKSFTLRESQVEALNASIEVSTVLFKSARADYMEVLMTQRDALDSRFDLVETRRQQWDALIDLYRALGGGWR